MGISGKTRSIFLTKANKELDEAGGQLQVQTILIGKRKFALTPLSIAIAVGSITAIILVFVVFKVLILGGAVLGGAIGGFLQVSRPGRAVGLTPQSYVLFGLSMWTGKPNKMIGTDTTMPFRTPKNPVLCGETLVLSDEEVQHLGAYKQQIDSSRQSQQPPATQQRNLPRS